jgi:hypothetical protein
MSIDSSKIQGHFQAANVNDRQTVQELEIFRLSLEIKAIFRQIDTRREA